MLFTGKGRNQSSSDNHEVSECVQTYSLHRLYHRMLFAGKERNQSSSDNKRSVSVYKLTGCMDCATGCCLQAKKEMGKSIKFRQQEVSECVQTYFLHGLCHRVLFAGKESDGKINQVQTTKRSVSVYKLTNCIDCSTGCCWQARKDVGKSIKFRQQRGQ